MLPACSEYWPMVLIMAEDDYIWSVTDGGRCGSKHGNDDGSSAEILKLNVLICFFILRGSDVLLSIYLLDYHYLESCQKCPPITSKKILTYIFHLKMYPKVALYSARGGSQVYRHSVH